MYIDYIEKTEDRIEFLEEQIMIKDSIIKTMAYENESLRQKLKDNNLVQKDMVSELEKLFKD